MEGHKAYSDYLNTSRARDKDIVEVHVLHLLVANETCRLLQSALPVLYSHCVYCDCGLSPGLRRV